MSLHAKLSPSGADRWVNCPGSLELSKKIPKRTSSYAEEGRVAHLFASAALQDMGVRMLDEDGKNLYTEYKPTDIADMIRYANDWAKGVNEWQFGDTTIFAEESVSRDTLIGRLWGTSDAIAITKNGKHMLVADYKYGMGVPVPIKNFATGKLNKQLAIYAYCALNSIGPTESVTAVTLGVFQPRVSDRWDTETLTKEELEKFIENEVLEEYSGREGVFNAGAWCRWCPAFTICETAQQKAEAITEQLRGNEVSFSDGDREGAASFLKNDAPFLRSLIKSMEDFAKEELHSGERIPGFKLTRGMSRRKWVSEVDLEMLRAMGWDGDLELPTPAQVEKIIGKKKLDDLTVQYPTAPKLAEDSSTEKLAPTKQDVLGLLQPLAIS